MLRKQPAGTYLAEPRSGAVRKVRARTHQFRLTTDNVLVAKETERVTEDRPVIPNVPYKGPNHPKTMTWKHLMLGAVHNTTTGQHRSAKEMELELSRLVCWWPPEDLKKDWSKWRERCKICV